MADNELLQELKHVKSDLGFRRWTRHRLFLIVVLISVDLLLSVGTVVALVRIGHVQHEACQRDNTLRANYIAQWQPVLDVPILDPGPTATPYEQQLFEGQKRAARIFQQSLDIGFAQHSC